jgi:hypothetical protein
VRIAFIAHHRALSAVIPRHVEIPRCHNPAQVHVGIVVAFELLPAPQELQVCLIHLPIPVDIPADHRPDRPTTIAIPVAAQRPQRTSTAQDPRRVLCHRQNLLLRLWRDPDRLSGDNRQMVAVVDGNVVATALHAWQHQRCLAVQVHDAPIP